MKQAAPSEGSRCFLMFLLQPAERRPRPAGLLGEEEKEGEEVGERLPQGAENLKICSRQLPHTPSHPISAERPVTAAHLRVVTASHLLRRGQPAAPSSDNKGKLANHSAFEVRIAVTRRRQEAQRSTSSSFPLPQDQDVVFHLQTEEGYRLSPHPPPL